MRSAKRILALVLFTLGSTLSAQTAQSIFTATGIYGGVCAHIGCGDGTLTTTLHNSGKMVVSALALSAQDQSVTAAKVMQQGLMGLVSVEMPVSVKTLPYAAGAVNLLVSDLDALGANAPADAEIRRVLSPYGAAYVRKDGSWSTIKNTPAAGYREWTHRYYGPEGNPVSEDVAVKPPMNRIRWLGGAFYGMDHKGIAAGAGVILTRDGGSQPARGDFWRARDAMNGVLLWEKKISPYTGYLPVPLVIDGKAIILPGDGQPLVSCDARTGEELVRYTEAGVFPKATAVSNSNVHIVADAGVLYIPNQNKLTAVNIGTGGKLWSYTAEDAWIMFTILDRQGKRLFFSEGPKAQMEGRWDGGPASAVTAVNATTGAKLWRQTSFVGAGEGERQYPNCTQVLYDNGTVYMFGAIGIISRYGDPFLGSFDAANGNINWTSHYQVNPSKYQRTRFNNDPNTTSYWSHEKLPNVSGGESATIGQVLMVVNGKLTIGQASGFATVDPATGKPANGMGSKINERCVRTVATTGYLIQGMVFLRSWQNQDEVSRVCITRSACAGAGTPAYGGLYFASGWCTCHTFLRGATSLSGSNLEPLATPLSDAVRVSTIGAGSASSAAAGAAFTKATSPIYQQWADAFPFDNTSTSTKGAVVTGSVTTGNLSITARVNDGLVEAKENGTVKWTFSVGGRVMQTPIVHDGAVYFGSHDGWVYSVNPTDGSLRWRFLAAPVEEKIGVHGQIASRWPVMGVGADNNLITCVAGIHSEADGGLYMWALNPTDGKPVHRVRLYTPYRTDALAKTGDRNSLINNGMVGSTVVLEGFGRDVYRNAYNPYIPAAKTFAVNFVAWDNQIIDPWSQQAVGVGGVRTTSQGFIDKSARIKLQRTNNRYAIRCASVLRDVRVTDAAGRMVHTITVAKDGTVLPASVRGGFFVIEYRAGTKALHRETFLMP